MRLTFEYPLVMKMGFNTSVEIAGSETLQDIRSLAFENFWSKYMKTFSFGTIAKHGSSSDVELSYWDAKYDKIVIENDEQLKKRFAECPSLQVIFTKPHPLS